MAGFGRRQRGKERSRHEQREYPRHAGQTRLTAVADRDLGNREPRQDDGSLSARYRDDHGIRRQAVDAAHEHVRVAARRGDRDPHAISDVERVAGLCL